MADRLLEFDIAVIGAGIAGLSCAQLLRQIGYQVVVLEKSRGVGGRIATRRLYGTRADHGAPFLDPSGELLRNLVRVLSSHGIVEPWTDTFYQIDSADPRPKPATSHWCSYYVAPAGINSVGKFLANQLPIWLNRRVEAIQPSDHHLWHIQLKATGEAANPFLTTDGEIAIPEELTAKAVVMAIPAPQAVMLLEAPNTGVSREFLNNLRGVEFDPCISVMVGYPAARQRDLAQREAAWRSLVFNQDRYLRWIGWDTSKRHNSQQPVFVLHSTPTFAEEYLEASDLQLPAREMLARAAQTAIAWLDEPEWLQVHRWRYAFCRRPWTKPVLHSITPLPIACAGDWCGENQIETALHSGLEAAGWVNDRLNQLPIPSLASLWEAISA